MADVKGDSALPSTVVFRLGTLAAVTTDRFSAAIEPLGLKPKHAGLMTALSVGAAASQQELAAKLGVVPSLVVTLADQLEALGAIQRVRDPADRRRQVLTLTDHGGELLAACAQAARVLDDELTAGMSASERSTLLAMLAGMAARAQLPI